MTFTLPSAVARRAGPILALLALSAAFGLASPTNVNAGAACSLFVNTDGNPPASDTFAAVGETVHVTGSFLADSDVALTFRHQGVPDDTFVVTAAADGSITLDGAFEVGDAGFWNIEGDDGSCQAEAFVTVTPVGDSTGVSVTTIACPPQIRTAEDLAADPDACNLAVLPADEPDFPNGFATPEIELIDFDYLLIGADGAQRDLGYAEGQGGGTCDPVAETCTFGWSYHWQFSALGETQLVASGLEGYRLGAVEVFDGLDPVTPTDVNPEEGSVTWNLDGPGSQSVRFYWFSLADPSPSPSDDGELPDTAASTRTDRSIPMAMLLLLAASPLLTFAVAHGLRRVASGRRQ